MKPAQDEVVGSCYGFDVCTPLDFRFLRPVGGGVPLQVSQWERGGHTNGPCDLEWERKPGHDLHARFYVRHNYDELWTDLDGWFRIDPLTPSIAVPPSNDIVRLEERIWSIPMALCVLRRGGVALHAAAVEVDGAGLLIGGPGRFGKTTLAGSFLRAGYRVLSEDLTCCRVSSAPEVYPGPALLRIREDVSRRVEFPGTHPVLEEPGRVHLAIDPALRGDGGPVPLRAMVFLDPPADRIEFEALDIARSLPNLWALGMRLPDDPGGAKFQNIVSLAAQVPAWSLRRPMRFDEMDRVVDALVTTCLST